MKLILILATLSFSAVSFGQNIKKGHYILSDSKDYIRVTKVYSDGSFNLEELEGLEDHVNVKDEMNSPFLALLRPLNSTQCLENICAGDHYRNADGEVVKIKKMFREGYVLFKNSADSSKDFADLADFKEYSLGAGAKKLN